jgi:hypothetical protein
MVTADVHPEVRMNMKRYRPLILLGLLTAAAPVVATDSMSINHFTPKVLPVLVQVDSHGKVTDVSPSIELAPLYDRLLRQALDEMITQPAKDHGRPMSSQFVMNLALRTTPRADGRYDAKFVYVSTSPVPAGSWYWVHIDGHRLALERQHAGHSRYRHNFHRWQRDWVPPPQNAPSSAPAVNTAVQRAPREAGVSRRTFRP